jgi:hypothetical protein
MLRSRMKTCPQSQEWMSRITSPMMDWIMNHAFCTVFSRHDHFGELLNHFSGNLRQQRLKRVNKWMLRMCL